MLETNRKKTIRNIIIYAILINVLAWLGPVLGGDPTTPGLGFLVWGTAPITATLVMKLLLRDKVSLGFKPAFKGNGSWYILSVLVYPVAIAVVLALGLLLDQQLHRTLVFDSTGPAGGDILHLCDF